MIQPLSQQDVHDAVNLAVANRVSREHLLAMVPPAIVARLPSGTNHFEQIASDLTSLVTLNDRALSCQLVQMWLKNLAFAVEEQTQARQKAQELLDSYGEKQPPSLHETINFGSLIRSRTRDFVGRRHIFAVVDDFLDRTESGYLRLEGHPGIGKTALMAQLARLRAWPCYFNSRADGLTDPLKFLRDLTAQLNERFSLGFQKLPTELGWDHDIFGRVLHSAARRLKDGERLIILVDALDEAAQNPREDGSNTLYLPSSPPPGVIFVVSTRPRGPTNLRLRTWPDQELVTLDDYAKENRADVEEFIRLRLGRPRVRELLSLGEEVPNELVQALASRSENNFMFLCYVIPELARGRYDLRRPESIPTGLRAYYEDHWLRMRMERTGQDHRAQLRVLIHLCELIRPVSIQELVVYTGEPEETVRRALSDWDQFVARAKQSGAEVYSIYHASFRDFLRREKCLRFAETSIEAINRSIGARVKKMFGFGRSEKWTRKR